MTERGERQFPAPIFVGGVGRSGTHVIARLIASHPRYHRIRTEARFHSWRGGLPDLCAGQTTMDEFLERMHGHWWKRGPNGRQGISRILRQPRFERALERFEADFEADRIAASRDLVVALLGRSAERVGKPAWVEVTGHNVTQAPFLLELFPEARFINMVRDGRAVVAGTLKKPDLTDEPSRALARWEEMIEATQRSIEKVPEGVMLPVVLEELTAHDREATFTRLIEFLEIDDPVAMREFFETEISAERAHVGAWRERMAPADARWVDRRYRRLVRRLRRRGAEWVPAA